MIRLFVALPLPADIRSRLAGLGGGVPGAKWTDPDNLHLTLRFIGNVQDSMAEEVDHALAGVTAPAFDWWLDGVGQFGTGQRPRILWAGVQRNDALAHLQQKIESALVRAGLPPEPRKFAPHVTLARLTDNRTERLGRFLSDRALFLAGPVTADHFVLYRSLQGGDRPVYPPLRDYPLTPRSDPAE